MQGSICVRLTPPVAAPMVGRDGGTRPGSRGHVGRPGRGGTRPPPPQDRTDPALFGAAGRDRSLSGPHTKTAVALQRTAGNRAVARLIGATGRSTSASTTPGSRTAAERPVTHGFFHLSSGDARFRPGTRQRLEAAGYTAAAKCLADDLDALVVHLRYPTRHRRRGRSAHLLERSLAEVNAAPR